MPDRVVVLNVRLDETEASLLDAVAEHEGRTRSDVMRRALKAYAESLGVTAKRTRKGK